MSLYQVCEMQLTSGANLVPIYQKYPYMYPFIGSRQHFKPTFMISLLSCMLPAVPAKCLLLWCFSLQHTHWFHFPTCSTLVQLQCLLPSSELQHYSTRSVLLPEDNRVSVGHRRLLLRHLVQITLELTLKSAIRVRHLGMLFVQKAVAQNQVVCCRTALKSSS